MAKEEYAAEKLEEYGKKIERAGRNLRDYAKVMVAMKIKKIGINSAKGIEGAIDHTMAFADSAKVGMRAAGAVVDDDVI